MHFAEQFGHSHCYILFLLQIQMHFLGSLLNITLTRDLLMILYLGNVTQGKQGMVTPVVSNLQRVLSATFSRKET